ncbi:MAG: hypothetical protein ABI306_08630 [Caulobacteraceae bacterium]
MSEPPMHIAPDEIQAHPPKVGHRWVDGIVAFAAIAISLISLFVAIDHGQTERKLVAANSWPFLKYVTEHNGFAPGPESLFLRIENAGVGPARIKHFVIRYGGAVMRDREALLQACCGVPSTIGAAGQIALGQTSESRPISIYPAREGVTFLAWRRFAQHSEVFEALNQARQNVAFEVCYCSVLDECWTTDLKETTDPKPVRRCPAPTADNYQE